MIEPAVATVRTTETRTKAMMSSATAATITRFLISLFWYLRSLKSFTVTEMAVMERPIPTKTDWIVVAPNNSATKNPKPKGRATPAAAIARPSFEAFINCFGSVSRPA